MKHPDYIKLVQWIRQVRFFCDRMEEMLEESVKHQQEDLHRYSETGKEYMKKNQI